MPRTVRYLILPIVALALSACGGGGTAGPGVDISGTYRVNGFTNTNRPFTATANLQQSGNAVTGTYQNNAGGQFRVQGTVSGTHVTGQLIGTNNAFVCSVDGDFFPDGQNGSGNYSCRAGNASESGSFTTVRI